MRGEGEGIFRGANYEMPLHCLQFPSGEGQQIKRQQGRQRLSLFQLSNALRVMAENHPQTVIRERLGQSRKPAGSYRDI